MRFASGSMISGAVERLLPGGDALVRCQEGCVLVSNAVPGDTVTCRIDGKRRGVFRARVTDVDAASRMRTAARCTAAAGCGGCALQFLAPGRHAKVKSTWVREAFAPFFENDTDWIPVKGEIPRGQRRRARWWCGSDCRGRFLGFRARASHSPVRSPGCAMVLPQMDALRLHVQDMLPDPVRSVRLTGLIDGMYAVFEGDVDAMPSGLARDLMKRINECDPTVPVQLWWRGPSGYALMSTSVRPLHDRVPAGGEWVELAAGPDDFVQGHARGNADMVRQLLHWAGRPRFVADFFSGIGNFSISLACATGAVVRGADASVSSCRRANANAGKYDLNARYDAVNLFAAFDLGAYAGADVLILDPPRKGAIRICRSMGALLPAAIIMVNCDVASGARDARCLSGQGYRLRALRAFDLFPDSGHVEAMSLWRR